MPNEATIPGSTAVARNTAPIRVRYTSHQVAPTSYQANLDLQRELGNGLVVEESVGRMIAVRPGPPKASSSCWMISLDPLAAQMFAAASPCPR